MESNKIERLLDAYFQGRTSLEEEALLRKYFNGTHVEDHLLQYKPIFVGLEAAAKVKSKRKFEVPEATVPPAKKPWRYAVAALLVVAFGVGIFFNSQSGLSQEEKEALAAFENSKRAMLFLSEKFNTGTERLNYVDEFSIAKNKVFE